MIDMDSLAERYMDEAAKLREELIGVLWDLVGQGDVKILRGGEAWFGHMFRSDLQYATSRLVELGSAKWINERDKYYIVAV